ESRVALAIGGAVRGLAAVAECLEVARIAGRPAAGGRRQVNDGELPVDRLLIGEIGGERNGALGNGDVHKVSNYGVHFLLWKVKESGLRPKARARKPSNSDEKAGFPGIRGKVLWLKASFFFLSLAAGKPGLGQF